MQVPKRNIQRKVRKLYKECKSAADINAGMNNFQLSCDFREMKRPAVAAARIWIKNIPAVSKAYFPISSRMFKYMKATSVAANPAPRKIAEKKIFFSKEQSRNFLKIKDVLMISSITPDIRMKPSGNSGRARVKDDG